MRKNLRYAVFMMATVLAGCTQSMFDDKAAPLSEKQGAVLAHELDGKIAGKPQNCLMNTSADSPIRVSDSILLYRQSGNLVYKNDLRYSCHGLSRDDDIMVTETFGGQLCSGDHFYLVDRMSGFRGPTCVLGEFVPYRKPAK